MSSNRFMPYEPGNMRFRRLGRSGLRVSVFSLGGWLTYGGNVDDKATEEIMKEAFSRGVTTFDTAEAYAAGSCERSMGLAVKNLNLKRSDLVLITKIFFGDSQSNERQNSRGLSRKHIVEGTKASLDRAGLEYWDVVMAHRPDPTVPMIEIVRAFNHIIDRGWAFYWGTSEWSAAQIAEAHEIAHRLGLDPPVADQCQYHAFHRERLEKEYEPLRVNYGFGTTTWSPLASGLLTGKYNDGVPQGSRFDVNSKFFDDTVKSLQSPEGQAKIQKVRELTKVAESMGCSATVLALAWVAKNEGVSTCILGATKKEQLLENLQALDFIDKLTPEINEKIEAILQNKPVAVASFGRM